MGLKLIGAVVLLAITWWVGWQAYLRLLTRSGRARRCPHCGNLYRGNPTYCPHCGEVVARWSNRR